MTEGKESWLSKLGLAVIAPVLVLVLAGGASPWWIPILFPSPQPSPSAPGQSIGPSIGQSIAPASVGPSVSVEATVLTGCVITIPDRNVALHESPGPFTNTTGTVPEGQYAVLAIGEDPDFHMRWFQIQVETRIGWVPDDTFSIEDRSAECP